MRYLWILCIIGALGAWELLAAGTNSTATAIEAASKADALAEGTIYEFGGNKAFLQLPDGYAEKAGRTYPAIVFLHGRGGSHAKSNVLAEPYREFRRRVKAEGYILAAPGYGANNCFNDQAERIIGELIRSLKASHPVDGRRVFLMGASMGGGASLSYAGRHPGEVAGICDVFGVTDWERLYWDTANSTSKLPEVLVKAFGGTPDQCGALYRERSSFHFIPILASLPIMIIHGENDRTIPISYSERLFSDLQAAGGRVEFIRVPGKGHDNTIIEGLETRVLDFFRQCPARGDSRTNACPAAGDSARGNNIANQGTVKSYMKK